MTRINRTKSKANIGYETRVFVCKGGQYYHLSLDCEMILPMEKIMYKEIRISLVKNHKVCPICGEWK